MPLLANIVQLLPMEKIGLDEHDITNFSTHPTTYNSKAYMQKIGKTIIGDHVWIGANAVILAGKNVGSHSVVAAGAVVTKNIPEYELWGGVPAKYINKIQVANNE